MRKTKIICTIGPASSDTKILSSMIQKGMDTTRLNFSHGSYENFIAMIKKIRMLAQKHKKNVGILQDLQGLKIRIGTLPENRMLKNGELVTFTVSKKPLENEIPVQYEGFVRDIEKGERVLLIDGKIELKVMEKKKETALLKVIRGGEIASNKGINIPDTAVRESPLTDKDKQDVLFGIENEVDMVALSFVKNGDDIQELRTFLNENGGKEIKIIAKIERREALKNLENIMQYADAVMIARGDLGVETSFEMLPIYQQNIMKVARRYGCPVITATQMLSSMIQNPVPTRAEITDISNAVFAETDALMVSDETAVGKYPVKVVEVLDKTAKSLEKHVHAQKIVLNDDLPNAEQVPVVMAYNGIQLAQSIKAKYLLIFTESGFYARHVARFRPNIPLVVFTRSEKIKRQLSVVYGMNHIYVLPDFDERLKEAIEILKKEHKIEEGEKVVFFSATLEYQEGRMDYISVCTVN